MRIPKIALDTTLNNMFATHSPALRRNEIYKWLDTDIGRRATRKFVYHEEKLARKQLRAALDIPKWRLVTRFTARQQMLREIKQRERALIDAGYTTHDNKYLNSLSRARRRGGLSESTIINLLSLNAGNVDSIRYLDPPKNEPKRIKKPHRANKLSDEEKFERRLDREAARTAARRAKQDADYVARLERYAYEKEGRENDRIIKKSAKLWEPTLEREREDYFVKLIAAIEAADRAVEKWEKDNEWDDDSLDDIVFDDFDLAISDDDNEISAPNVPDIDPAWNMIDNVIDALTKFMLEDESGLVNLAREYGLDNLEGQNQSKTFWDNRDFMVDSLERIRDVGKLKLRVDIYTMQEEIAKALVENNIDGFLDKYFEER